MAPGVGARGSARQIAGRRRRWPWVVALLVLVVPLAEIAVIVQIGSAIGGWPTFLILVAESAVGAWLVKREGVAAWAALQQALRTGRMPSRQLADAALVLVGGTLLLTPGFLTDLVGFLVVLPVTRPVSRAVLEAAIARRVLAEVRGGGVGPDGPRGGPGWAFRTAEGHPARGPGSARRPPGRAAPGEEIIEGEIVQDEDR